MAQRNLYINTTTGNFCAGLQDTTQVDFPISVQGDVLELAVWLLAQGSSPAFGSTPLAIVSNAGLTFKIAIGYRDGDSNTPLLTSQFVWAADALNQYLTGTLPLNTDAINQALGDGDQIEAMLEVKTIDALANAATILQNPITIYASVIHPAALSVPAGLTPISAQEVSAGYLKIAAVQGKICYWESADGTKKAVQYLGNDGAMHFDPVV